MQKCRICGSTKRKQIDELLIKSSMPLESLALLFGYSVSSLWRHSKNHLKLSLSDRREFPGWLPTDPDDLREAMSTGDLAGGVPIEKRDNSEVTGAVPIPTEKSGNKPEHIKRGEDLVPKPIGRDISKLIQAQEDRDTPDAQALRDQAELQAIIDEDLKNINTFDLSKHEVHWPEGVRKRWMN